MIARLVCRVCEQADGLHLGEGEVKCGFAHWRAGDAVMGWGGLMAVKRRLSLTGSHSFG